jgi:putative FmdB family regulatory protein
MAMPIYEYACPACDASFETLILRKSDEAEVACPTCGSRRVARHLSRPAATRGGRGGSASGGPPPNCGPIG